MRPGGQEGAIMRPDYGLNGTKFNPRQFEALTSMDTPTTAGSLMELVHGENWIRSSIPNLSSPIEPLHNLADKQYTFHNTRKETILSNHSLSLYGGTSTKLPSNPSVRKSSISSLFLHRIQWSDFASSPTPPRYIGLAFWLKSKHELSQVVRFRHKIVNTLRLPLSQDHSAIPLLAVQLLNIYYTQSLRVLFAYPTSWLPIDNFPCSPITKTYCKCCIISFQH